MTLRELRRDLLHHLAKAPWLYRWLLTVMGRGSAEKRLYLRLIRQGDTVFDVGANIGYFTLLFSDLVGQRGSVHSFEPVPQTFAILEERIRWDGRLKNAFINPVACSDTTGNTEILVPGGDFEQASIQLHTAGKWSIYSTVERFPVHMIRLDDYAAERQLTRLDFIKCDAEGAEPLVLAGAAGLLKQFEPLLMLEVAEFWLTDFGYSTSDLVDLLEKAGYSYFFLEEERVPLDELRDRLEQRKHLDSINMLCACQSRAWRLKGLLNART